MNGLIEPQLIMANNDADDSEDEILKLGEKQRCKPLGDSAIKKEPEEESDIQNFAETTMNELLGWYGYDKVNSRDTQSLRLTVHRFTSQNGQDRCGKSSSSNNTPPTSPHSNDNSSSSDVAIGADDSSLVACSWCKKVGSKLYTLQTANGTKTFCSETCFNQCRRASFKKYKICDWCKHVRHTVNYVDFQDGEQQLQFCSDKCLNQYKMHIFCKEAQAHLQMHQHLSSKKAEVGKHALGKSAHTLITPELWMRDCKDDSLSDETPAEAEPEVREKETIPEKTAGDLIRGLKPPSALRFSASGERRRRLHRSKNRERRHHRRELPLTTDDVMPQNDVNKSFSEAADAAAGNALFPPPNCSTSNANSVRLPSLVDTPTPAPPPPRFPMFMHGMAPPTANFGFNYPRNFLMDQVPPPFLPRPPPAALPAGNLLPPPTLMIPYPVMLPVPFPVPIPIPLPIRECDWKQLMTRKGLLLPNQPAADSGDVSDKSEQKSSHSDGSSGDSVTSGGEQSKSAESEPEAEERRVRAERERKRAVEGDGEGKRKCLRTRLSAK